jgi:prepilin-type N-terminal cleavage/methylation domain-containing protein
VRKRGLTLIELLVAMGISSILMTTVVVLYGRGMIEVQHSSGRVELLRRGRGLLERIQPLLCSAVKPRREAAQEAIYVPDVPVDDLIDNGKLATDKSFHQVVFATPVNHLAPGPLPTARELTFNPKYYLYEIAQVPGEKAGQGNQVVLRRVSNVVVNTAFNPHQFAVTADQSVAPRVLGRDIDWLNVRYVRAGALQVQVLISSDRIQDEGQRSRAKRMAPYTVEVSSLIQIPYYSNN